MPFNIVTLLMKHINNVIGILGMRKLLGFDLKVIKQKQINHIRGKIRRGRLDRIGSIEGR